MRTRTWAIFIGVNIVVSALVMLAVLLVWQQLHPPESPLAPLPTPASTLPAVTGEAVPSLTPPPVPSPTAGGPLVYTIQEGDTLMAIARTYNVTIEDLMAANGLVDPNTLHVGQTLIIPLGPLPTPTTSLSGDITPEPTSATASLSTPLPTLTPSGPPVIEIGQVLGSGDLAAEVVVVRNRGGTASLEGWTLSDAGANTFTFPAITLFPDAQVCLHSATGSSTPTDLYWGRTAPAWTGGTLITLRDTAGNVVDTYVVP